MRGEGWRETEEDEEKKTLGVLCDYAHVCDLFCVFFFLRGIRLPNNNNNNNGDDDDDDHDDDDK